MAQMMVVRRSKPRTHQVMLNDCVLMPDGKVFRIDEMELSIQDNPHGPENVKVIFSATGPFLSYRVPSGARLRVGARLKSSPGGK